jgi:hypothetical protein
VLCLGSAASAQSLADVARQYREKESAEAASGNQPRVFTNKDLPADPNPGAHAQDEESAPQPQPRTLASRGFEENDLQQGLQQQRFAHQQAVEWRARILAQQDRMASLQARLERLNASLQNQRGTAQFEGPSNRYQAFQMERAAELQMQLDQQRRRLEAMQDAARRAGMHSGTYEP